MEDVNLEPLRATQGEGKEKNKTAVHTVDYSTGEQSTLFVQSLLVNYCYIINIMQTYTDCITCKSTVAETIFQHIKGWVFPPSMVLNSVKR